jgi:hypothetical protein
MAQMAHSRDFSHLPQILLLRVLGSIPRRLTIHHKGLTATRGDRARCLGCGRLRCLGDRHPWVAARHQVAVDVGRYLDRGVPHLLHVDERLALGLLLADSYAKRHGIESTWRLLLIDVISAAVAAVTIGSVLASVGRTASFVNRMIAKRRDKKR